MNLDIRGWVEATSTDPESSAIKCFVRVDQIVRVEVKKNPHRDNEFDVFGLMDGTVYRVSVEKSLPEAEKCVFDLLEAIDVAYQKNK